MKGTFYTLSLISNQVIKSQIFSVIVFLFFILTLFSCTEAFLCKWFGIVCEPWEDELSYLDIYTCIQMKTCRDDDLQVCAIRKKFLVENLLMKAETFDSKCLMFHRQCEERTSKIHDYKLFCDLNFGILFTGYEFLHDGPCRTWTSDDCLKTFDLVLLNCNRFVMLLRLKPKLSSLKNLSKNQDLFTCRFYKETRIIHNNKEFCAAFVID